MTISDEGVFMTIVRSFLMLFVLAGSALMAADTPQVDPKILDVLNKVEAQINISDYLSYEMKSEHTNTRREGGTSTTTGTVWVKRVDGDDFLGAYVHVSTDFGIGPFDYFYAGKTAYEYNHKAQACTVFDVGAFENGPNHPGKARMSLLPFNELLIDRQFSQTVVKSIQSASMHDSEDGKSWIIKVHEVPGPSGMKSTKSYSIDKKTHEIGIIYSEVWWQGIESTNRTVYSNYCRDEAAVQPHILMPEGYKPDYPQEPFRRDTKTIGWQLEKLEGLAAPVFDLKAMDGKEISLTGLKDKLVVIDFWETWCGACRVALPKVKALQEKWGDRLQVLGIVTGNAEGAEKIVAYNKLPYPNIVADKAIHADYKVKAFPTYFLIDKDGRIVTASAGNLAPIEAAIEKLLGETSNTTQPATGSVE